MQCAAALARAPVAGRPHCTASRPSRSSTHTPQRRIGAVVCRAVNEDDNPEADNAPKSFLVDALPTSEEVKQAMKDFQYKGNLMLPMLGIAAVLTLLASVFPGHA